MSSCATRIQNPPTLNLRMGGFFVDPKMFYRLFNNHVKWSIIY